VNFLIAQPGGEQKTKQDDGAPEEASEVSSEARFASRNDAISNDRGGVGSLRNGRRRRQPLEHRSRCTVPRLEDRHIGTLWDGNDEAALRAFRLKVLFEPLAEEPCLAAHDAVVGRAVGGGAAEDVDADLLLINLASAAFDE
jgi:hypothetical protein